MSNLSTEDWNRRKELVNKSKTKHLNSDEMAEMVVLNCKLYGMKTKDD